jgi:phosphoadenosine phosphosulfate reductase
MNLDEKIQHGIALLQKSEALALKYNDFGYHLAFSGGKDSQAILELAKMAGVKFRAYFYKTSVDPVELLKFIKTNYPDVIWIKPEKTMYQLILKKGMLPLRYSRFCCEVLKERQGINSVVITGITAAESSKRAKRKELEHSCIKGQDKIFVHPIFNWTVNEVWQFLKSRGIESCELYKNRKRIGCVGCPMNPKSMRQDFREMPNFKKAYINTVQKLIDEKGKYSEFPSAEDVVDWWASGLSRKKWFANKSQYKIEFTEK